MKRLTYARPNRLPQLLDELQAAVPALRPVAGAGGLPTAVMTLSGDDAGVVVEVPDGVDEAAVAAVVAAHAPTAPPADPGDALLARFNDGTPLTAAEIRACLRFLVRRVRGVG